MTFFYQFWAYIDTIWQFHTSLLSILPGYDFAIPTGES